ncbi:hypothetical protein [Herbidospora mongoliensis]|uniref:hypothetical protein n=1 Tax=Herbidospora mongoliensis TaxID=688067 RepID=UPI000A073437|nr:hypothetical protein [Herbidospora mongoliensis]
MLTVSRHAALAVAALAVVSLSACSGGDSPAGVAYQESDPAPVAAAKVDAGPAPTVEELAKKVGCKVNIQVDAEELRTGACSTKAGDFFVNTFATEKGKDAWMDQAPEYNPHLVGRLWTVLGTRETLDKLRADLGGDLHLTDHRVTPKAVASSPSAY